MIKKKYFNRKWVIILPTLALLGVLLLVLTACAQPAGQESLEMLFSPTPSLTTTATVIWFPETPTAVSVSLPTQTPNPIATPSHGALLFSDNFLAVGEWQDARDKNGNIIVKDGSLTLAVNSIRGSLATFRKDASVGDFYLETIATVSLCKPDDQIGVLFRVNGTQSYYRLLINCQGLVALQQVVGGTPVSLRDWAPSGEVQPGLWHPIKIGILAAGKVMRIYIDDKMQMEINRDTFMSGGIGFFARAAGDTPLTVSFSSLSVYQPVNQPAITSTGDAVQ